ncbi:hypothetical protein HD554DRAFT_2171754 [Boletus coccyginus]|nr:hypothetical protein HD554DRAFT_2171754 [Boletus coccyginus]
MAGQHGYQTKHFRLVSFLVLVCLAAGLVRRTTLSSRSSSLSSTHRELAQFNLNPDSPAPRPDRIHGRWKVVRASLGLPPPHEVVFAPGSNSVLASRLDKRRASRFDLGRKRWADEAARQLPQLHFASDTRAAQPDETETVAAAF